MNLLQKTLAGLALAGFAMAQPMAAQAAPVRTAAPSDQSEELAGHPVNALLVIGVFALLLLLAEVTNLIDIFGNDDELPTSP
jgi:hypothetical protein